MYPKLITLYGPFELNSYNTALMVGLGTFTFLTSREPALKKIINPTAFMNLIIESALVGILGGRLLHVISCWSEYPTLLSMLSIWDGGLSILGAFIAVLTYGIWSIKQQGLPFFEIADTAALYAPLFHGIARIGCFLVGCCHGAPTSSVLSVTYTDPQVMAPLHVALHPTQLYSSALFFLLFALLLLYVKKIHPTQKTAGTVTFLYIMGMSLERFCVDFLRGDRIPSSLSLFSFHQWVALLIFGAAGTLLVYRQVRGTHESL
jgi:phosphatidylglycerol---prolipoprotein diacylglyceryl transferase